MINVFSGLNKKRRTDIVSGKWEALCKALTTQPPNYFYYFIIVALAFVSCKNGGQSGEAIHAHGEDVVLSNEVPADFVQFYMKFFADTTYQLNHIVFPLKMKNDNTYWQKDEWEYHKAFSDDTGQFKQEFVHVKGLVLETISDDKGLFKVMRRYIKRDDGYDLIYYTKQNAFENTEGWEKG